MENYEDEEGPRQQLKMVLIGDSGVGKSNIISRYATNQFNPRNNTTIGLEYAEKQIKINRNNITLQIWDTAGQERFRALNRSFYSSALGALAVFDLSNKSTLENLGIWLKQLRQNTPECVVVLVGNKCDIRDAEVSIAQAKEYALNEKVSFLETSAAQGTNIREAFQLLTRQVMERHFGEKNAQIRSVKQRPARIQPRKHPVDKPKRGCCS